MYVYLYTPTFHFEYGSVYGYRVDSFSNYGVYSQKSRLVVTTEVTTEMCHTFILNTGSGILACISCTFANPPASSAYQ